MIVKVIGECDFLATARYLSVGHESITNLDEEQLRRRLDNRVAWIEARELAADEDWVAVGRIMSATAARKPRLRGSAAYHVAVSWGADENVPPELQRRAMQKLVSMMELDGYQVLGVGHHDTAQDHFHLLVNRVHPETGRLWSAHFDYNRWSQAAREVEMEMGFHVVAGRERGKQGRAGEVSNREYWEARRMGSEPFGRLVRGVTFDAFEEYARTGDISVLEAKLARFRLRIEPAAGGRGYRVTDGREIVKLSAVAARGVSRRLAEQGYGRGGSVPERGPDSNHPGARELIAVERAAAHARTVGEAQGGIDEAQSARGRTERPEGVRGEAEEHHDEARATTRGAAPASRQKHRDRDPAVESVARELERLRDRAALEQAARDAPRRVLEIDRTISDLRARIRPAERARDEFTRAAHRFYKDPTDASYELTAYALRHGHDAALRAFRRDPLQFGAPSGRYYHSYHPRTSAATRSLLETHEQATAARTELSRQQQLRVRAERVVNLNREAMRGLGSHRAGLERAGAQVETLSTTQRAALVRLGLGPVAEEAVRAAEAARGRGRGGLER